jgi:hypothetical protein
MIMFQTSAPSDLGLNKGARNQRGRVTKERCVSHALRE